MKKFFALTAIVLLSIAFVPLTGCNSGKVEEGETTTTQTEDKGKGKTGIQTTEVPPAPGEQKEEQESVQKQKEPEQSVQKQKEPEKPAQKEPEKAKPEKPTSKSSIEIE